MRYINSRLNWLDDANVTIFHKQPARKVNANVKDVSNFKICALPSNIGPLTMSLSALRHGANGPNMKTNFRVHFKINMGVWH